MGRFRFDVAAALAGGALAAWGAGGDWDLLAVAAALAATAWALGRGGPGRGGERGEGPPAAGERDSPARYRRWAESALHRNAAGGAPPE